MSMRRSIAISHIRPELEAVPEAFRDRYAVALEAVLGTYPPPPNGLNPKTMGIVRLNGVSVLNDPELPDHIKELVIDRLPEITRDINGMLSRQPDRLLIARDGTGLYGPYTRVASKLRGNLIKLIEPSGVTFGPRSMKLFAWCREELEHTAHPLVGFFKSQGHGEILAKPLSDLWDVCNLLILQIACGDDVADTIQNEITTSCFARIPFATPEERTADRATLEHYFDGIFLPMFDQGIQLWDESVAQLEQIFTKPYFDQTVKPRVLELYGPIMDSLTYSAHLNTQPHDTEISIETIQRTLAPNMMVEFFRFLEQALVEKIATETGWTLPSETDVDVASVIVSASQRLASMANAAATAPRERRENDLSSPVPFAMSQTFTAMVPREAASWAERLKAVHNPSEIESTRTETLITTLTNHEQPPMFSDIFEAFLRCHGYFNHFYGHYADDPTPASFDYLSLLGLRKSAVLNALCGLKELKKQWVVINDSDYHIDTLGQSALKLTEVSPDETIARARQSLSKSITHIHLIDAFSDYISQTTQSHIALFTEWRDAISQIQTRAESIKDPEFRIATHRYIASWENFLCMYLIFKRANDGTI